MTFKSAWSRGFWYGAIFGGAIAVFPLLSALLGNAPIREVVLGSSAIALMWGAIGFLAGYASHSEPSADSAGNPVPSVQVSLFRRLLYRFVAGLLLSYIAGMVLIVIAIGVYFLWEAGVFGPEKRPVTEEIRHIIFVACYGLLEQRRVPWQVAG
jgi:hypothetical protein